MLTGNHTSGWRRLSGTSGVPDDLGPQPRSERGRRGWAGWPPGDEAPRRLLGQESLLVGAGAPLICALRSASPRPCRGPPPWRRTSVCPFLLRSQSVTSVSSRSAQAECVLVEGQRAVRATVLEADAEDPKHLQRLGWPYRQSQRRGAGSCRTPIGPRKASISSSDQAATGHAPAFSRAQHHR